MIRVNINKKEIRMNKLVKKWEPTGLLGELNDSQKNEMAIILDDIAKEVLILESKMTGDVSIDFQNYVNEIIPISRRVYADIYPKKFPDIKWFMEDYKQYRIDNNKLYEYLKNTPACDYEAEFIALYCEDVKQRI